MTDPLQLDAQTAIWILSTIGTIIIGLLTYIFTQLNRKVSRIEDKLDALEAQNAKDHVEVGRCLARLEEGLRSQDKDIQRHERRLDELEGREE